MTLLITFLYSTSSSNPPLLHFRSIISISHMDRRATATSLATIAVDQQCFNRIVTSWAAKAWVVTTNRVIITMSSHTIHPSTIIFSSIIVFLRAKMKDTYDNVNNLISIQFYFGKIAAKLT